MGYSMYVSYAKVGDEPSNNRTRVRVQLHVIGDGIYFQDLETRARLTIYVNGGGYLVKDNGEYVGTGWTLWEVNRPTHTDMAGYGDNTMFTQDVWVYHSETGYAGVYVAGEFESWGYYGTPTMSDTTDAYAALTNYDRSPTTPTISSITRSSDGSQISTFNYSGGVNNSGPAVTYTLEYWTSATFPVDPAKPLSAPGNAPFNLSSPTTAYYFRVRAANSDGTKFSAVSGVYYGVPSAPTFASGQGAKTSSTVSGSIDLSWTAPTNTQTASPAVPTYDVYRNNVKVNTSPVTGTTYSDTGLVRGTSYSYNIISVNATGYNLTSSKSATVTATASGVPAAPSGTVATNKVGRNVTVSCQTSPNDYGNIIVGYRVQYSTDDGLTWSEASVMTNRSYTYNLLPAALTYVFRCYAINSIGNGDTLSATPIFVSAGGRRKLPGGEFEPTQTAKRYDSTRPEGQKWVDLNTAKRYSSAANGGLGGWIDLS